tara:strand:+ start:303 stop:1220 length:918 start_codon:yes stop_codon:yes gene_type:complete
MTITAGVDEVGRGPLAGPVVAAAVILPHNHTIEGLRDSKKLSKMKREFLFPLIHEQAIGVGLGEVDVKTIDKINIREATFKAMQIALNDLSIVPEKALIDGHPLNNQVIPNEGIVGGDNKVDSIKAASIIAKVTRDRIMKEYAIIFPEYDFENNSGYGTKKHMDALKYYRATPIHRRSFKPVKKLMPTFKWLESNGRIVWIGKKIAALYIKNKGLDVVKLDLINESCGHIDIIAKKGDQVIFIDVNTSYMNNNSILEKKDNDLRLTIDAYCRKNSLGSNFRIDTITVILRSKKPEILHNKDIRIN